MYLVRERTNLANDHKDLIGAIGMSLGSDRPAAVVIDTLNRSIGGSESSDSDMAAYIQAADAIRDAFGCAVIIVHHCGIDEKRPRGHTSLGGAVDAQLAVERKGDAVLVRVQWMKDGPKGEEVVSVLEPVEVGTDRDGDSITSLVVEPPPPELALTIAQEGRRKKVGPKLPAGCTIALRALREAIADAGEIAPASNHIPQGTRVTTREMWKQYSYKLGISPTGTDSAQRVALERAVKRLVADEAVKVWGNQVWIPAIDILP